MTQSTPLRSTSVKRHQSSKSWERLVWRISATSCTKRQDFASNVAWSNEINKSCWLSGVDSCWGRKKCVYQKHHDVFSWVTTSFYFFEACDSGARAWVSLQSRISSQSRTLLFVKVNRRNSVYTILRKRLYHVIINFPYFQQGVS